MIKNISNQYLDKRLYFIAIRNEINDFQLIIILYCSCIQHF